MIIDDLFLRSTSLSLLLLLLECYFCIYFKFCTTLNLYKCDFLQDKFEFVGHDILSTGNTTAESKYDLISNWPLPVTADSLYSFISLCNFYNWFLPLFEMKVTPLRQLYMKYIHKEIPSSEWTDDLKLLFNALKTNVTSQPVCARYDSSEPVFLKTDWSSLGMSFILMQPSNDKESTDATATLLDNGICKFDLSTTGP